MSNTRRVKAKYGADCSQVEIGAGAVEKGSARTYQVDDKKGQGERV